jgi:hypothetical protein
MSAATKSLALLPNLRKQEMLVSMVTKVTTVEGMNRVTRETLVTSVTTELRQPW